MSAHCCSWLTQCCGKLKWWIVSILIVLVLAAILTSGQVGAIVQALTPPKLPELPQIDEQVWLDQNWDEQTRSKFHHISQGTHTLPIPYRWFVSLEQPSSNLLGILFPTSHKLADNDYLLRFGFIKGSKSAGNPDGLPIGFAITANQNINGLDGKADAIGFTCAACHTGQFVYEKKQYVIDGGPAMTDLGQLTAALGAALAQTALSSQLPLFDGRFNRFARNVLGERYSDLTKEELKKQLMSVLDQLKKGGDIVDVTEGFSRVDALNRIGNQVFSVDYPHRANYSPINAPVNFPHIWTSSWFDWVQYDGSIMSPIIRNAGEALGVSAFLDTKSPANEKRFGSSISIDNLHWIEHSLAGQDFGPGKPYTGLNAPKWPAALPPIDAALAKQGSALYEKHCQGCHLPPLSSPKVWDNYGPIKWTDAKGNQRQTSESVLKLHIIPHSEIGTDMAQATVLMTRTVDISGRTDVPAAQQTSGMGLKTMVCGHPPADADANYASKSLVTVPFSDGGNVLFALALGATVQQTVDAWFEQNYVSASKQQGYTGDRPNCLQAGAGYRARPLNGVWATGPYLHNGSVPTLMDLLSPVKDRPKLVQLGGTQFDPVNVGVSQNPKLNMKAGVTYARNGLFILDTSLSGNHNTGHEFSSAYNPKKKYDEQAQGVIGPELSVDERKAIIEYLKTL